MNQGRKQKRKPPRPGLSPGATWYGGGGLPGTGLRDKLQILKKNGGLSPRRSERSDRVQGRTHPKSPGRPRSRRCLQVRSSRLVLILKIIDRFNRILSAPFNPSIKLLERLLKSNFALGRFPRFEIPRQDEELPPDLEYRNAIFLNDSAEMARRVAGFECRARDVEKVSLRLALSCVCAHLFLHAGLLCIGRSNLGFADTPRMPADLDAAHPCAPIPL